MAMFCSTTAIAIANFNSTQTTTTTSFLQLRRNGVFFNLIPKFNVTRPSFNQVFIKTRRKSKSGVSRYASTCTPFRPVSPVMEWQDCTVRMEVDIPISVAYDAYSDREAIPRWMPFISSVKILEDKPDQSRWTLKYKAFGRDIEFSWLARNMQPIRNQKIHWRSLEGLPNRGAVRFYPKGPSSCIIELTVSYEVPTILRPVASAVRPFLESLLMRGLEQFVTFAKTY
ncbi:hypothetical protein AQUCO_00300397v1 [Aquilegia coerulea]|uniref:Coenzyme Q-binding protein COQ10 START domain-containing protein n=1 Tax=Aquilegia coerulea TaxID=218851 RepID=A0A2G5EYP1_AQUCA|nr:hypothetical protein AQUCO_00300397v1 [Aquilegia coerulea]